MKFLALIGAFLISTSSFAKDDNLMVEIDPLTFVQSGYSLHIRYVIDSLVIGGGVYALDMPKFLVEMSSQNKGFEQRIDQGYSLFLDYTFDQDIRGPIIGLEVTTQSHTITFNGASSEFDAILYLARVGYHYEPFSNGFYLFPWLGVGYANVTSGKPEILSQNKTFDFKSLATFATLHVGYRF